MSAPISRPSSPVYDMKNREEVTYLCIMAEGCKVTLPNLLAMIILLLIHPTLTCSLETAVRLAPVEILALVGALVAAAVLKTFIGAAEVLSIGSRLFGEVVVPLEIGAAMTAGLGSIATS